MTHIHVSTQAVAGARSKAQTQETKSPAFPGNREAPESRDHEMTQAWSIGVTSAARAWTEPAVPGKEPLTCPPEVYIG